MIARRTRKMPLTASSGTMRRAARAGRVPLSRAELTEFKRTLQAKRRELIDDIVAMVNEGAGEAPEFLDIEWDLLREIEEALSRIESRTYGICEATGTRITKARLRACPWARYCTEYARQNEKPKALANRAYRWPDDRDDCVDE